jgi:hypothetical protein
MKVIPSSGCVFFDLDIACRKNACRICDASGTSGSAQDRNGLDPKGAGPAPKEDAPTVSRNRASEGIG